MDLTTKKRRLKLFLYQTFWYHDLDPILVDFSYTKKFVGLYIDGESITLSDFFIERFPLHILFDVCLHEVAHHIHFLECGTIPESEYHNDYWKDICKSIGAVPEEYQKLEEQYFKDFKYLIVCPDNGVVKYFQRLTKKSKKILSNNKRLKLIKNF